MTKYAGVCGKCKKMRSDFGQLRKKYAQIMQKKIGTKSENCDYAETCGILWKNADRVIPPSPAFGRVPYVVFFSCLRATETNPLDVITTKFNLD